MAAALDLVIRLDDLAGPEIAAFMDEHVAEMKRVTPPESKHALDLEGLRRPDIQFWTIWDGAVLAGCGGLKRLDSHQGEIKAMRTRASYRGTGVASSMLRHIVDRARAAGYHELLLETGSFEFFEAARQLYLKHGFDYCGPFGDYVADPNSVFMMRRL